jgi:hypothetical protein
MTYELSLRLRNRVWINWLNKEIYYENDMWKRQEIIFIFVRDDLVPFIKQNGYSIGVSDLKLAKIIARELFHIINTRIKKISWHSPVLNDSYRQEDIDQFYYSLNPEKWNFFWNHVRQWCDIDEDERYARNVIEFAVWTCLDLDSSLQTRFVNQLFDTNDSEDEGEIRIDQSESYTEY